MRKALGSVGAVLVLLLGAQAAEAKRPPGAADTREVGAALRLGKALPIEVRAQTARPAQRAARAASEPGVKPTVGTVKTWLALDDLESALYYKDYTLRAVGDNIEVWVANDLSLPVRRLPQRLHHRSRTPRCRTSPTSSTTSCTRASRRPSASRRRATAPARP